MMADKGNIPRTAGTMPSFLFTVEKEETSFFSRVLRFCRYYPGFRVRVFLGLHNTRNPVGLRWRWKYLKHSNK
jgi:hypothetical protein